MFDKYTLCEEGFRNVTEDGAVSGFELLLRIAYYRSLRLSMVEGFVVTVDGETFAKESILFTAGGRTYTYHQMEVEPKGRWEFGEKATLFVPKPGGLAPGTHRIQVVQTLRISYSPAPVLGIGVKTLVLPASSSVHG